MVIIFIQSSFGSIKLPDIEFDLADKLVHFFAFGILGILTARGLRNSENSNLSENYYLLSILVCILYGASDEIHQYFVPGRYTSWGDWMADVIGAFMLVWLYKLYIERRQIRK